MPITKIYRADRLFTGDTWLHDQAVFATDGVIDKIIPAASVPAGASTEYVPGSFLAPAFIDLQIYGAHQRLFAVYPDTDSLKKLDDYCRGGGAVFCMPTVATNKVEVFYRCIDAIREYWRLQGKGILGLHIEGPWISKAKRGAHIESFIHAPTVGEVNELLAYGKDVIKMITLAPEVCTREVINLILDKGIIVSAGHSDATYDQAMEGFNCGIRTATHLFNAMSPLQHRGPGMVGAIFNNENVMCSIIADGHHVDYAAIRIARKVMGNRLFAITDAVTETNEGYYQHYLAGDKYEAAGILSGSALTMGKAMKNLVTNAGFELEEALRLCSLYPARVVGMERELGKIEKGAKARMVVISEELELIKLID